MRRVMATGGMVEKKRLFLRARALVLIPIVEAAAIIMKQVLPAGGVRQMMSALVVLLLYALCILAGYDLRTRWALLVTPLLAWGSMIVYFILTGNFNLWADLQEDGIIVVLFILGPSLPFLLLALLGLRLGKRAAR